MRGTLINLDSNDTAWLVQEASRRNVSISEIVHLAVCHMREQGQRTHALREVLTRTAGIWNAGDGLKWQRNLRGESDHGT